MIDYDRTPSIDRSRKTAIFVVVAMLHVLVLWWFTLIRLADPAAPPLAAFDVTLFNPPSGGGGGTPAQDMARHDAASGPGAPSSLHLSERTAPETLAVSVEPNTQVLTFGASLGSDASAAEGRPAPTGTAGEGSGGGTGSGVGAGAGQGGGLGHSGVAAPVAFEAWQLLRRPSEREINRTYPTFARSSGINGQAVISCAIGLDTQLRDCRVLRESPRNFGFGDAGLKVARDYRYRPPVRYGQPVDGQIITFSVDYLRGAR